MPSDWTLRAGYEDNYETSEAWQPPEGFEPVTQLESARMGIVTPQMQRCAQREGHLTPEQIRDEIAAGRMVLPANKVHLSYQLDPLVIGRASKTKVNANMGASPVSSDTSEELEKLHWADRWGADTVMDLSTGGDLDQCRDAIVRASKLPIGTVPIYSMILGRTIEDLTDEQILKTLEHQARQGVDYFTPACWHSARALAPWSVIGLSALSAAADHSWPSGCCTTAGRIPLYDLWDDICDIMRRYDVTFSIGDGLRPGGFG